MTSEFQEVFRTFNLAEADFVSSRLTSAGFHPSLQNEQSTLWLGSAVAAGGFRVLVPSGEHQDAIALLAPATD